MWPFRKRDSKATRLQSVTVTIPWVGTATFVPDEAESNAAWSIYVEIVTRVPTQPLGDGSLREALTSVYQMFMVMRTILRASGPQIAHGRDSLAPLVLGVLNDGLRPFLSEWHSKLSVYESTRDTDRGVSEHEDLWSEREQFTEALDGLREKLGRYADELLKIAGGRVSGD